MTRVTNHSTVLRTVAKRFVALFTVATLLAIQAGCGGSGGGGGGGGGSQVQILSFENFQAAQLVIGQADFTATLATVNATTLDLPFGNVSVAEGRLFIGDYDHHRVLGYNAVPTSNGAAADFVLGQADF